MKTNADYFKELSIKQFDITNFVIKNENDPFKLSLECDFANIGKISIEPFSACHFSAFQEFYDGKRPEWGLSKQSRSFFDEHTADIKTLNEIAQRVAAQQDARFVIITQNHIIGYLLIEEINCIKAGRKTYFGEDYYAMLGIGISDRFHGTGLASFAMLFLKFVAAIAGVGLGLSQAPHNERACRFYEKHGFIMVGYKEIFVPHTGTRQKNPWYILKHNEVQARNN